MQPNAYKLSSFLSFLPFLCFFYTWVLCVSFPYRFMPPE